MFFGRTDAKAETPALWPPHEKSWLIVKDSDAGRNWRQEEKGMTEDEMVGWHHQLDGHEFGWSPGVGVGQGSLACCNSWGCKGSDMTEWLNWTEDGSVIVESSEKTWSTGEGNGKPLHCSCLENPMNSMKRQKYRTLKDELPRCVGAQYSTREQWRNNSRKNDETELKQKQCQLWMWLEMEVKSDAVKSSIA